MGHTLRFVRLIEMSWESESAVRNEHVDDERNWSLVMTQSEAPQSAEPRDETPDELVPAAEFNVRDFARTAVGSHRTEIDAAVYVERPLDQETLDLVASLARLEHSTMRHLRSVLVTPTHKDARVTAFLVTWAYEKYWVADALETVLAAHPSYVEAATHRRNPLVRFWLSFTERVEPMHESVVANAIGEDVVAVHTMTGAADEWVTRAAYVALAERTEHPEFRELLAALLEVKARHELFWALQSRDRLKRSPSAAALTRRRLARAHLPLGVIDEAPDAAARFFDALITDDAIADIDSRIAAHPGLDGLRVLHTAASAAGRTAPQRVASWIGRTGADLTAALRSTGKRA